MNEIHANTATTSAMKRRESVRDWGIFAIRMAVVLSVIYVLLGLLFCLGRVKGRSMEPTFRSGNVLFGIRTKVFNVDIRHGDILLVWDNDENDPTLLTKRVIGLPGDVIEIDEVDHVVYRNGERLDEPYLTVETPAFEMHGPVTVEDGNIIVMGDNRINSLDSRSASVGQIPLGNVLAKVICRVL